MSKRFFTRLVAHRPLVIIILILVVTVILGYGLSKIKIDTDPTDDIPDTIPAKKFYDEVGKIFPTNDFAFIAIKSKKGIFNIKTIEIIKGITEKLQQTIGIKKVISLYNTGIIKGTKEGLIIEKPLQEKPIDKFTQNELERIKKTFLKNDLTKALLSKDLKSTAIIATLKEGTDDEPVPRIIIKIKDNSRKQVPEIKEITEKIKSIKAIQTIPAIKKIIKEKKNNFHNYNDYKYTYLTLILNPLNKEEGKYKNQLKIIKKEFKKYFKTYGKPHWRYRIEGNNIIIRIPIRNRDKDSIKSYEERFVNNLNQFRIPDPKSKEIIGINNILTPLSQEDKYNAKVNYLINLNQKKKNTSSILIIPDEDVYIPYLLKNIKLTLKGFKNIKIYFKNSPIPSYYRIKNLISYINTNNSIQFYISGTKAASTLLNRLLMKDLSVLFPVVILIIILILYLSFHTFRGVFLPLLTVILSVIWAMGLMGLLGQPLSMATMILPIILIAVGTAYTIHVINSYYQEMLNENNRPVAIIKTLEHVRKPILLAGITTMIGFGSLGVSRIDSLKMFGILSAIGIASALLLSLSLASSILVLMSPPKTKTLNRHSAGLYTKLLRGLGNFTINHKYLVIIVTVIFVVLSAVKIPNVRFETNTVNNFKKKTEIRQSTEFLNRNFSGITVMKIIVRTKKKGEIYDPKILKKMDSLQSYLEALRIYKGKILEKRDKNYNKGKVIVGGTQSIITFIKGINRALHDDDPSYYRIPPEKIKLKAQWEKYRYLPDKGILEEIDSESGELITIYKKTKDFTINNGLIHLKYPDVLERIINPKTGKAWDIISGKKAVSNYILLYANAGNPEDLESFVDNNVQTAQINVFIKSTSSNILREIQDKTKTFINKNFDKDLPTGEIKADVTGLSNLILTVLALLVKTLIQSILMSLGVILIMITILSRSIYEGILSIIPLGVALIINFGIMGWFKLPLDMSTATIASIAIGIGIDYTIHFIEGYKKLYKRYGLEGAVIQTDMTTGKAILFNAVAVAGGFCALLFSQIRGNVYMGLLMALIMITSSIGSITLLPSLLCLLKPGFIKRLESNNQIDVRRTKGK